LAKELDVGVSISPGYAYERAPDQEHFLNRRKTKELFRRVFSLGKGKKWRLMHSSLFLDFLAGNREFHCTPWGMPTRNVFGWQKPCYLLGEGYVGSFKELMETTDWDSYGTGRYEKCANCMAHCGYEPTAANATMNRANRRPDGAGDPARSPEAGGFRLFPPCRNVAGQSAAKRRLDQNLGVGDFDSGAIIGKATSSHGRLRDRESFRLP
jgi:hypothetical protein